MAGKVTTVKDVALLSGVSRGTVDRVLHNRPGVSAENIRKVREAVEQLDFEPNVNASALAQRKPRMIALLMPSFGKGEYWEKMYEGFMEGCESNRHMSIHGMHFSYDASDPETFRKACDQLLEAKPSGVVLSPFFLEAMLEFTRVLHSKAIPYVYVDSRLDDPNYLAYFGVPMYRSGYLCASLLTMGQKTEEVREVAVVRIFRDKERKADPTLQRRMGFYEYMNENFPECSIYNIFIDPQNKESIGRTLDEFFSRHPEVRHVVMFNSRLYLIDDYLKSHPDRNRRVVGFDSLEANMSMLKSSRVSCLIAQHIEVQSQLAVATLSQFLIRPRPLESKEHHMHMDILTPLNCEDY